MNELFSLVDARISENKRNIVALGRLLKKGWIDRCKKQNRNLLIVITGDTGSGKSWAALTLAKHLDRSFNVNRVVFTPVELIRLVRSKLKPASAIVLDEAQIPADHRKWFSATVNAIRYITQTARFKNNILIFTTPDMDLIDADARKLFHYIIEMRKINYKHNYSVGEIAEIVRPSHADSIYKTKTWKVYPRIVLKNATHIIKYIRFPRPPKKLREAYEAKKEMFMDRFYQKLEVELAELMKDELTLPQIADEIIHNIDEYRKADKPNKLDLAKIMLDFGVSRDKARQVEIIVKRRLKEMEKIKKEEKSIKEELTKRLMEAQMKKKKKLVTQGIF